MNIGGFQTNGNDIGGHINEPAAAPSGLPAGSLALLGVGICLILSVVLGVGI